MNPIVIPKHRRTLSRVDEGEDVRVISVAGGRGVHRRLRELGIGSGSSVKVVQNSGGPVIVLIGESRMGLGRGVADKILVE
jgi:ferrous iron transport protein A